MENAKRKRGADESPVDSPEEKHLRADFLLDILEEVDAVDRNPVAGDLADVMKSFEEEIGVTVQAEEVKSEVSPTSTSGSDVELGYLLEASDDELGLPPTVGGVAGELGRGTEDELNRQAWGLDDEIPSCYDSFDLEFLDEFAGIDEGLEVHDQGLFDHSLDQSEPYDVSDVSWFQESLPAV